MKVIITGTTGMVGEGVLHECLKSDKVTKILSISRKPCGYIDPKLEEILIPEFSNLKDNIAKIGGYDACFFCLGVSSVKMDKRLYYEMTYDLTLNFAKTLKKANNEMVFCYISGKGTDSTEKSRLNWANVKGKTENDLLQIGFTKVYNLRPGFIKPTPGMKRTHPYYKFISWIFPIGRMLSSGSFCTLEELGKCLLFLGDHKSENSILEGDDIIRISRL